MTTSTQSSVHIAKRIQCRDARCHRCIVMIATTDNSGRFSCLVSRAHHLKSSRLTPDGNRLFQRYSFLLSAVCSRGSAVRAGGASFAAWGLTAGLLVSCGLAVAAGFCSVFPTLAWIGLAGLLFRSSVTALAAHSRLALGAGMVAAAVMTVVQVWRVRTGRFVPTISDGPAEPRRISRDDGARMSLLCGFM